VTQKDLHERRDHSLVETGIVQTLGELRAETGRILQSARPWINMQGAATERISGQVERCPSGELTRIRNENQ